MMYENFMRFWLSLIFVVRLKRMKFLCFYQIKHVRYSYCSFARKLQNSFIQFAKKRRLKGLQKSF